MKKQKIKVPTIALCMIVKNEEDHIEKTINSVSKYINEYRIVDTGSTDNTVKILEKLSKKLPNFTIVKINPKDNPEYFVKIDGIDRIKFAKARNLSFDSVKSDWILWLDGDDVFEGGEFLHPLLVEADRKGVNCISCTYNYRINSKGIVETSHPKERLLRNGKYFWEYDPEHWLVHENLYPHDPNDMPDFAPQIAVNHEKTEEGLRESEKRNTALLSYMIKELPDDPRVRFLYGRDLFASGDYLKAAEELALYLNMDYTPHDGLIAAYYLTLIAELNKDFNTALEWALQVVKVKPDHPLGYVLVAKFNLLLGNTEACLKFIEDSRSREISVLDPVSQMTPTIMRLQAMLLAEAYERLEEYEKSIEAMRLWLPYADKDEQQSILSEIEETHKKLQIKKVRESFKVMANVELRRQTAEGKKKFDLKPFIDLIERMPDEVKRSREVLGLKRHLKMNKKHERTITFYCALNFEEWDPETIISNGGGGSETAVVELASRFASAGYKVDVYANPPEEKEFQGVNYYKESSIDFADEFDIFICWRNPYLFKEVDIKARKKFLWLQDIMFPEDYTKDLYEQLDKIIVLSGYHRKTALHVPENKFYYTTNGINLDLIEEVEKEMEGVEREKGYCLYCSSADRGLQPLVEMLPEVRKKAKGRWTWFYGWNSWNKIRNDHDAKKFQKKMIKLMKKNGVKEGGRIGKKELYREMFKAQFLTYPLIGPAETSCIVMMEAQACGLIPISTGITALEETQQFGIKVPLSKYQEVLIEALNKEDTTGEYRKEMMKWAREKFNWDTIAQNWIKDLFN